MWTNATRDWTETSDFITLNAEAGLEYEFGANIKGYVGVLCPSTLHQWVFDMDPDKDPTFTYLRKKYLWFMYVSVKHCEF